MLVQAGFHVWHIKQPVDLLVWNPRKNAWTPMEVKSPRNKKGDPKKDKRQEAQNLFIDMTGCPVVTSPEQALEALK